MELCISKPKKQCTPKQSANTRKKMNPSQKELLKETLDAKPFLQPLAAKLLLLGGNCPVIWNSDFLTSEKFVSLLLELGRVTNGETARLQQMTACHCHRNAQELSLRYPSKYQTETGFALSKDGLWRPHSWVWDTQKSQIIETTELRVKYFGTTGL